MAVKLYKPTSAGRRIHSVTDYSVLYKKFKTPKHLIISKAKPAGRNSSGKITVRHQGGGAIRKTRLVDFSREDKKNIPAKVVTIEYDPTRTAFISMLAYADGAKRFILTPQGLKVGDKVTHNYLWGERGEVISLIGEGITKIGWSDTISTHYAINLTKIAEQRDLND